MPHEAGELAPSTCTAIEHVTGDELRVVESARTPAGRRVVVVRAIAPGGIAGVLEEAQLLGELEAAGATALPRVLGTSATAYVREDAPPWGTRSGRRRAETGSPATAERVALAAARELLDASVSALHERGYVLGLEGREGLALRPDGSVVVTELGSLRRAEDLASRRADQRWVDGVLGDQGRTLRRRHETLTIAPRTGDGELEMPVRSGPAAAPSAGTDDTGRSGGAWAAPPAPATWHRNATGRRARLRRPRARRPRRLLAGAVAVALVSMTLTLLIATRAEAPTGSRTTPRPAATRPTESVAEAPAETSAVAAPEDPVALVAALASARRAHVVGGAGDSATLPSSPAAQEDGRLAEAYAGIDVAGWETQVVSAEVTALDTAAGTATVRARVAESPCTLTYADGSSRVVPAAAEHDVELHLAWEDGRWLLTEVAPA